MNGCGAGQAGGEGMNAQNVIGFWRDRRTRNVSRKRCRGVCFAIIVVVVCMCF